MTNPFTVTFSRSVPQVGRELQLETTAVEALVLNTSSSATVVVNTSGPALLDGSGTTLTPGQSATMALQASNGGTLILSAIATGPDAKVEITMTPPTLDVGGTVILAPGVPTEQP
jgi:hypothetical protein